MKITTLRAWCKYLGLGYKNDYAKPIENWRQMTERVDNIVTITLDDESTVTLDDITHGKTKLNKKAFIDLYWEHGNQINLFDIFEYREPNSVMRDRIIIGEWVLHVPVINSGDCCEEHLDYLNDLFKFCLGVVLSNLDVAISANRFKEKIMKEFPKPISCGITVKKHYCKSWLNGKHRKMSNRILTESK